MLRLAFCLSLLTVLARCQTDCPDQDPELVAWNPVSNENQDYVINGEKLLLTSNYLRLRSIKIQNGGKLVISDQIGAVRLEFKYLLILSDGEFHVGSSTCRFQSELDIMIYGRSNDTDIPTDPVFGRKFIGVAPTGTISLHGADRMAWTKLASDLNSASQNPTLDLADDVTSWKAGDRVVVASSDYDMYHAEEFIVKSCSACGSRQLLLEGAVQYTHLGSSHHGVDMFSEVGLLTRNIRIFGEMQPSCYGSNYCQFFNYDTFGGHIMVVPDFKRADFQGVELYHMGQQVLGRYPIHYHIVGKVYGSYVKSLSIHNCFSRCVTLHGAEGLLVQDVVGYDTLGHCFFMEDGNEQYNQLIHNLGLVTKPGTLLPSDRDKAMCEGLLGAVYPGYVPIAEEECMSVSTFWIAHPNNTIRNNSAAGSVNNGYHFIFHREPTGKSVGTLPPFHGERAPIVIFSGNKAHSNVDHGLLIDHGVKIHAATEKGPAELLAVVDYARYMPHQNGDLLKPRSTSVINELTSYKNSIGASVRGGEVSIRVSKFSDNDVAVILQSDDLLPGDSGAHQELIGSYVVASNQLDVAEWQARTYPSVGVQLKDGPVLIDNNHFYGYTPAGGREAYAIGFFPQYDGQFSIGNTIGYNTAEETTDKVYFGRADPTSIHDSYDRDGDLNQVLNDINGTLTGWPGSYAVRLDNYLMRGDNCFEALTANAAVCTGDNYGQIYVNASTKSSDMKIEQLSGRLESIVLRGANRNDSNRYPDTTQYQSSVVLYRDYRIHFITGETPNWLELAGYNFPQNAHVKLEIPYQNVVNVSEFQLTYNLWKQMEDVVVSSTPLTLGASEADVDNDASGLTYYWDQAIGLLYFKLVNRYPKYGYDYCSQFGCQIIQVTRQ